LKIQSQARQATRIGFEIKYSLSSMTIQSLLFYGVYWGAEHGIFDIYHGFLARGWQPVLLGTVAYIAFSDAYFYFAHRMLHSRWLYQKVHIIHHRSINPTPFATYSVHPLEALINFSYIFPLLFLIPISWELFIALQIAMDIASIGGHFGLDPIPRSAWKSWWGRWLTTPTHHNLHHQAPHFNFGLYWRGWDEYLKTLHPKTEAEFYRVKDQSRS
jgi:sterol desaturase/sphingolipid hydroxylase (fatty acid hydroxylase superfamily)